MNIRKKLSIISLNFILMAMAQAQTLCTKLELEDSNQKKIKSFSENIQNIVAPEWEGLRPGDLLGTRLYIPLSLQNPNQKDRIAIQSSSTNSWNPSVPIDGMRFYQVDGVVRTLNFKYENNITNTDEMWLNVNAFILNKGRTVVDDMFFTSDKSIEKVHTLIGQDNPFGRKDNEFDTANFIVRDENGNETKMKAGDSILGRFDIGYVKRIELINSNKNMLSLDLGHASSIPLSKLDSRMMMGFNQQITGTKKVSEHNSVSIVLNASETTAVSSPLYKNSTQFSDHKTDYGYGFALLFAHAGKKGGKTTYGVELMGQSSPLNNQKRIEQEIKETVATERPSGLKGSELPTKMALTNNTALFGFGVAHTSKNGISYQAKMAEDLSVKYMLGGSTNRQDFSFYMSVAASSSALKNLFIKKHPKIKLDE